MLTHLSSGMVMSAGDCGRVLVQHRSTLRVLCVIWQVWEVQKARLFWFVLLSFIGRVHDDS